MPERRHWLAGRLAIITGASRGIGAATAEAIAAAGAHVVLAARNHEALDAVARRVRDAGGKATTVATDVSELRDVERLFAAAEAAGPRPAKLLHDLFIQRLELGAGRDVRRQRPQHQHQYRPGPLERRRDRHE